MNALLAIFHPKHKSWKGCRPLSAPERMERYSQRHAEDMRQRENEGAGIARAQIHGDRLVLSASPGRVNRLPNHRADETHGEYEARMEQQRRQRIKVTVPEPLLSKESK